MCACPGHTRIYLPGGEGFCYIAVLKYPAQEVSPKMDFSSAINWLTSPQMFTGPFGHHRMEFLLSHLDDPQEEFPAVLVGGTNGKGSVTVLLESIFSAGAEYQVGATVSPHLVDLTERVRFQCGQIPTHLWVQGTEALKKAVRVMEKEPSLGPPSFFELITALAFFAFRETYVDLAFVEVGLGGRLDATNVCHPEISVITNIGTDHKEILGPDKPSIAREKLGIIRPKRPLVTAERDPEIRKIFQETCDKVKAPLFFANPEDRFNVIKSTPRGHLLAIDGFENEIAFPLPGLHQLDNLAVVLEVVRLLSKNGFEISPDAICKGISQVSWPGRLQWLSGPPPILTDGAHNAEGLSSLVGFLEQFPMERPCHLVLGALKKKPVVEMAIALAQHADTLSFVPPTSPRSVEKSEFDSLISPLDPRWSWHESLESALAAGASSGSILVTGSLYLVADLLRLRGSAS